MKIGKDFLLTNEYAKTLYNRFASDLSVTDYSCRIPFLKAANSSPISTVWEIWQNDESIIRAMRACGTEEKYITGDSSDYEKFRALCGCMPSLPGRSVYLIAHMALQTFFGCGVDICRENCDFIWNYTADVLQKQHFDADTLLNFLKIDTLCASADIAELPEKNAISDKIPRILPVVCTDALLAPHKKEYVTYIKRLSKATGVDIDSLSSLELAIKTSFGIWRSLGCKILRCDISKGFFFERPDPYHAEQAFLSVIGKAKKAEYLLTNTLTAQILRILFAQAKAKGFTVQLCFAGNDSVSDVDALLAYMKEAKILPKIMLIAEDCSEKMGIYALCEKYSIGYGNMPSIIAGIGGEIVSDKKLKEELVSFAEGFALGKVAGTVTNASSMSALLAHDIFKRTLCSLIGEWMEEGRISNDMMRAGVLIKDICSQNARSFFDL